VGYEPYAAGRATLLPPRAKSTWGLSPVELVPGFNVGPYQFALIESLTAVSWP